MKTQSGHKMAGPKEATLSLLKQFARIYAYNENMRPGLGNFIPN